MTFTQDLRGWLHTVDSERAQRAERAQPVPAEPGPEGSARCARSARPNADQSDAPPALPAGADLWGSEAIEHYSDRLATAAELEMDAAIGSPAEQTARREAMRIAAGIPYTAWPCSREPGAIDVLLAAFPDGGGLRWVGFEEAAP